jgi:hypothetical protein
VREYWSIVKKIEHQLFFTSTPLLQYSKTPVETGLTHLNFLRNTGDHGG